MNTNSQNDITDQYVDELSHDEEFNHTTYEDDYNTQDDSVGFEEDLPIEKTTPVSPRYQASMLAATQGLKRAVQDIADACTGDVKVNIVYITGREHEDPSTIRGYEITTTMTYLSVMSIVESGGVTSARVSASYRKAHSPGDYHYSDYHYSSTHPLSSRGFVSDTAASEIAKTIYY